MRRRGITLIELLLALTISSLVMAAAGTAYIAGTNTARTLGNGRDVVAKQALFEATLADLFRHAYIDTDAQNRYTFFQSGDAITGSTTNAGATGQGSSTDANALVFTVLGRRLPATTLSSTDDFETNNSKFGPVGGVTEVELSTTPIGDGANGQQGLFLREQTPSDGDPSQGGEESLLNPDVETISFEYFDGTDWQTTWDTSTMGTRRLPSAVRVTYKLRDESQDRVLTFSLPASDVTPDNPVTQGATS
jgi:prepilin-type N-terminal cleavage/methylation domain-containing protein